MSYFKKMKNHYGTVINYSSINTLDNSEDIIVIPISLNNKSNKINNNNSNIPNRPIKKFIDLNKYISSKEFDYLLISNNIDNNLLINRVFALRTVNRDIIKYKGNILYFKTKREARIVREEILIKTNVKLFLTNGIDFNK